MPEVRAHSERQQVSAVELQRHKQHSARRRVKKNSTSFSPGCCGLPANEGASRPPSRSVNGWRRTQLYRVLARDHTYSRGDRVFADDRWYIATQGGITASRRQAFSARVVTDGTATWRLGGGAKYHGELMDADNQTELPQFPIKAGLADFWPLSADSIILNAYNSTQISIGSQHEPRRIAIPWPIEPGVPFRVGFDFGETTLRVGINGTEVASSRALRRGEMENRMGGPGWGTYHLYGAMGFLEELAWPELLRLTELD